MLKKGTIRKVQPSKGEFAKNLFLVKNKNGGQRQVKIEATECTYPILPLQNGRFAKCKIYVAKRRLHAQTSLKRCIFFSPFGKKFKAIYLLPLVKKLVQVPLSLLWFGTSTTNIHKIAKSANDNLTQDKHQYYNSFRQHAIDLPLFRRDTHKSRHSNLPSATSRICHKLQKFCIDTSARNRVFGPNKKLCHYRTFFKQNKNSESCFRISEFVKKPTNINSGVDKVDWMLTSTIQAVLPARLNCCFLQRQQISFSEKNCFE